MTETELIVFANLDHRERVDYYLKKLTGLELEMRIQRSRDKRNYEIAQLKLQRERKKN